MILGTGGLGIIGSQSSSPITSPPDAAHRTWSSTSVRLQEDTGHQTP